LRRIKIIIRRVRVKNRKISKRERRPLPGVFSLKVLHSYAVYSLVTILTELLAISLLVTALREQY
jgi:hypothetical protein